jgi:DNA-directed RNA polymerase specialized sigma24 family protein
MSYLYARYVDDLREYLCGVVGDRHLAEELACRVMRDLPERLRGYTARGVSFVLWLRITAWGMTLPGVVRSA